MPSPQSLSEADRRLVAAWAADCAERVLVFFETEAPTDGRPRDAIARIRAFAQGELDTAGEIRRRFGRCHHSMRTPRAHSVRDFSRRASSGHSFGEFRPPSAVAHHRQVPGSRTFAAAGFGTNSPTFRNLGRVASGNLTEFEDASYPGLPTCVVRGDLPSVCLGRSRAGEM